MEKLNNNIYINSNERLDDLQINGLKIIQNPQKYCFTSDSVLLSSFAKTKKGDIVIDFCSGSGVIAILIYAKNDGIKKLYCIEIQKSLAEMSKRSILLNNLDDKIEVLNIPVQNAYKILDNIKADVVVCNPPYSKKNTSILNLNDEIAIAKHEIAINIKEILISAKRVLKFKGKFYMVHQADRIAEIMYEMVNNNIQPKILQTVSAREDKKPHLVLIEGIYGGLSGTKILKPLYIYDKNNEYTIEAKEIYNIK